MRTSFSGTGGPDPVGFNLTWETADEKALLDVLLFAIAAGGATVEWVAEGSAVVIGSDNASMIRASAILPELLKLPEIVECLACARQLRSSGAQCDRCRHNRQVIAELRVRLRELQPSTAAVAELDRVTGVLDAAGIGRITGRTADVAARVVLLEGDRGAWIEQAQRARADLESMERKLAATQKLLADAVEVVRVTRAARMARPRRRRSR